MEDKRNVNSRSPIRAKALVQKVSAEGETVAFEVRAESIELIEDSLERVYAYCDKRLAQMNVRILEGNELLKTFTQEERVKFYYLLDVINGYVSSEVAKNRINIDLEDRMLEEEESYVNQNGE
jgi:hypothetical protein